MTGPIIINAHNPSSVQFGSDGASQSLVFSVQFPDPLISGLWLLGEKEQLNAGAHINFVIKSHLIIIIE